MQNMGAESSVENRAKQAVLVQRNWQTEKVEERALRFMMHTHLQQVRDRSLRLFSIRARL